MDASGRAKRAAKGGGVKRRTAGNAQKPTGKLAEHPAMKKLADIVVGMTPEQRERFGAFLDAPSVSDQLREAVKASGISRYRLWKLTGIDQAVLCRFVAGKAGMALDNFDELCRVLGLELRPRPKVKGG